MKPIEINIPKHSDNSSFNIRNDFVPNINSRWHCHKETELVWFLGGSGVQYVGDSVTRFKEGDVVLVGPYVPHFWKFDECYTESSEHCPYATVIHFNPDFLGDSFLNLPENFKLKLVFEKLRRGVAIPASGREKICELITSIINADGIDRIYFLLKCMLSIADEKGLIFLTSPGFEFNPLDSEQGKINAVYQYVKENIYHSIRLEEVAALTNLTPPSFCRYFKSKTGKTFSHFLKEMRIGYACKLLIDNQLTIKDISYESGFSNLTSFYQNFRAVKKTTPVEYQRKYLH